MMMEVNSTIPFDPDEPTLLTSMDVWMAGIYIVEAALFIPLQIFCFYLIKTDKEMSNATYSFILNLAVADCLELSLLGIYAGLVILGQVRSIVVGRVASFLCLSAWYANCVLFPLIAFSRWIAITRPHEASRIFSKRNLYILHALAWLLMGIPSFYGNILSGTSLFPFLPHLYTWAFDSTTRLGSAFNWINLIFDSICTTTEILFNVLSLVWVHRARKSVRNISTDENHRREMTLLIQCVILCCIFTATYVIFTIVSAFKLVVTLTTCLILQAVWTFNHSVNPIVYFIVNERLRKRAVKCLTRRKMSTSGRRRTTRCDEDHTCDDCFRFSSSSK